MNKKVWKVYIVDTVTCRSELDRKVEATGDEIKSILLKDQSGWCVDGEKPWIEVDTPERIGTASPNCDFGYLAIEVAEVGRVGSA